MGSFCAFNWFAVTAIMRWRVFALVKGFTHAAATACLGAVFYFIASANFSAVCFLSLHSLMNFAGLVPHPGMCGDGADAAAVWLRCLLDRVDHETMSCGDKAVPLGGQS
jgi:hypothetical protein